MKKQYIHYTLSLLESNSQNFKFGKSDEAQLYENYYKKHLEPHHRIIDSAGKVCAISLATTQQRARFYKC